MIAANEITKEIIDLKGSLFFKKKKKIKSVWTMHVGSDNVPDSVLPTEYSTSGINGGLITRRCLSLTMEKLITIH